MAEEKAPEIGLDPESDFFRNLAKDLNNEKLEQIAEEVIMGYENDLGSLTELDKTREKYNKLFNLKHEPKDTPWDNAANIMLPTITTACSNFWARTSQNLFPADNRIVNVLPIDNSDISWDKASRVKRHMNWQLMTMPDFFEGFNKTLMSLSKDGYAFRKTYWDSAQKKVISTNVLPQDFIINYYTTDLKNSQRFTQVLYLTPNQIKIKIKQGIYLDENDAIDEAATGEPELPMTTIKNKKDAGQDQPSEMDYATPRKVLEIHTFLHIGDDDIRRPYIVTVDYDSRKILRIITRENPNTGLEMHYFTNYNFLPNPDSIFGFGFGPLLLGATAAMNAAINQTVDAGTLSTSRGGFIKKGSQMSRGSLTFKMGQFKQINTRENIRDSILPLEFAPPSQVLLNLIEFLQGYIDRLTTVTEVFSGQIKSDQTATATSAAVEQGSKVFTGIQMGIHRAFKEELQKIYQLNGIFLDETEYLDIVTGDTRNLPEELVISQEDYNSPLDIIPVSDPRIISQQQQAVKAEFLSQIVQSNPFIAEDPIAQKIVLERLLESSQQNQKDINDLLTIMDENIERTAIAQEQQLQQMQAMEQQQLEQQNQQQLNEQERTLKDEEREITKQLQEAINAEGQSAPA